MNEILWLIRGRFMLWSKRPVRAALALLIPLAAILLYFSSYQSNGSIGDQVKIGVVDKSKGDYTASVIDGINTAGKVKYYKSQKVADEAMTQNEISASVNFGSKANQSIEKLNPQDIYVKTFQGKLIQDQTKEIVQTSLEHTVKMKRASRSEAQFKQFQRYVNAHPVKLVSKSANKQDNNNMMTIQIIGFMLMMMLFFSGDFSAEMIQDERANYVYYRLLTTPLSQSQYLIGTEIFAMLAMTMEAGITVLLMNFGFHIDPGMSYWKLFMVLELFAFMVVFVSMMIGVIVKTRSSGQAVQTLAYVITSLLSGALIPIAVMPKLMQHIARLMPQYWIIDMISKIQKNQSWQSIGVDVIVILTFTLLFFSISLYTIRNNRNTQQLL